YSCGYALCLCDVARPSPTPTLFPYTTLFRSKYTPIPKPTIDPFVKRLTETYKGLSLVVGGSGEVTISAADTDYFPQFLAAIGFRSEEHTSELQSRENLVCRLLLEKKNQLWTQ